MHLKYENDPDKAAFGSCDLTWTEGNDLYDAVYISLLSYARGVADDTPNGKSKYGWWIDDLTGYKTGSKIWTLQRAKITSKTLPLVEQYLYDALQWMIEDGVCANLKVTVWNQADIVKATIDVIRSNNDNVALRFDDLWKLLF